MDAFRTSNKRGILRYLRMEFEQCWQPFFRGLERFGGKRRREGWVVLEPVCLVRSSCRWGVGVTEKRDSQVARVTSYGAPPMGW